jgi:aspartokinase/homoserine dehydrogenase 1
MGALRRRVIKFGGTSVGSVEALRAALAIVVAAAGKRPVVVVVSALAGVTDALEAAVAGATASRLSVDGFVTSLRERHLALLRAVASGPEIARAQSRLRERLSELDGRLRALTMERRGSPAARDAVLALGERLSAPIVAAGLRTRGIDAHAVDACGLIRTDARFGEAAVDFPATRRLVTAAFSGLPSPTVPVVTGFIGATEAGDTTVLGRGGSDYTAAVLGWALEVERVEIWSDVDGVLSADPRLVPAAATLPRLSYREATALAAHGAKVLHPKTLRPLEEVAIPVLIRNTLRPAVVGTRVGPEPGLHDGTAAVTSLAREGHAEVLVLGGHAAARPDWARDALAQGGVRARHVGAAGVLPGLRLVVDPAQREAAVRALHEAFAPARPVVSLVVAGPRGRVAGALLAQLERHGRALGAELGIELRLVGAFDRHRLAWSVAGLRPSEAARALERGQAEGWREALARLRRDAPRPVVFVDGTASEDLAAAYASLLEAGVAVVTPNKVANSRPLLEYRRLRRAAARSGVPYLYRTTVGAGLPVLRTVRDLARTGDHLRGLRAVLSGTLSFVLGRVQEGVPFTRSVEEARSLGLTEPDPNVDLSGEDVARKLLLVLRDAGLAVERDDVAVESLVPRPGEDVDGLWAARAETTQGRAERLVHAARWEDGRAAVGVISVPEDEPLARVRPGENVVALWTDRYRDLPLTLSGPGAGPEVTAGNLLSDVVLAAERLVAAEKGATAAAAEGPASQDRRLPRPGCARGALPGGDLGSRKSLKCDRLRLLPRREGPAEHAR